MTEVRSFEYGFFIHRTKFYKLISYFFFRWLSDITLLNESTLNVILDASFHKSNFPT